MQGIVPDKWAWNLAGPTIVTPPFATVQYDSEVSISVEPNKLQVADNKVLDPNDSQAAAIVKRYVEVVPHVLYTAVGINFRSALEIEDANAYLKSQFLRYGPWDSNENPLQSVGLKFVYPVDAGSLVLSIDGGNVRKPVDGKVQERSVILANANFHRELDQGKLPTNEQIPKYLHEVSTDWDRFRDILSGMLPIEEEQND